MDQEYIPGTSIGKDEAHKLLADLESIDTRSFPYRAGKSHTEELLETALKNSSVSEPCVLPQCRLSHRYSKIFEQIRAQFPQEKPTVFVPGHGPDTSHYDAFPDAARIINLDMDPSSVELHRKLWSDDARVECHLGVVQTFTPPEPADLIISLCTMIQASSLALPQFLKPGAYVWTNHSSTRSPLGFSNHADFHYKGTTTNNLESVTTEAPTPWVCRVPVNDEELLRCGPPGNSTSADYASMYQIVHLLNRDTSNVVTEYQRLREVAAEELLSAIRTDLVDKEVLESRGFRQLVREADPETEEGYEKLHKLLLEHYPLELNRRCQRIQLPVLPFFTEGIGPLDIAIYQYCPKA